MKIQFTRSVAMIDVSPKAGDVLDRPDEEARSLIAAGYATPVQAARGEKPAPRATSRATRRGGEKRGG